MAKKKRIGANAALKLEGQKNQNRQRISTGITLLSEKIKHIIIAMVLTAVTISLIVVGYEKINLRSLLSNEKSSPIEWRTIGFIDDEVVLETEDLPMSIAYLNLDKKLFKIKSDMSIVPIQYIEEKLPLVMSGWENDNQKLIKFLKKLKQHSPKVYKQLSQLSLNKNELELHLESVVGKLKIRIDNDPYSTLNNFVNFVDRYPLEVAKVNEFDLRFTGFLFTQMGES